MKTLLQAVLRKCDYGQIMRFAAAGFFCAGLEYLLFVLLTDSWAVKATWANFLSLSFGMTLNYVISRKWVFSGGRYSSTVEFTAFVVCSVIGVVLNQYCFWILAEKLLIDPKASKLLAIGCIAAFNFLSKRFLVFREQRAQMEMLEIAEEEAVYAQ